MTQLEQVVLGAYASSVQVAGLVTNRYNFTDDANNITITTNDYDYQGNCNTILIQSDGKVCFAGDSGLYDGSSNYSVVKRFAADGSFDSLFATTKFDGEIWSLGQQSDGKIIVAGWFSLCDGNTVNGIARLNTDGTYDSTFTNGGFSNGVYVVKVLADDTIICGGDFSSFDGTNSPKIAKLNSDGTLDTTFATNSVTLSLNDSVYCLAKDADDKLYLGGDFSEAIVKINSDCTVDESFDPGIGFNGWVSSIAIQDDGKLLCGGYFDGYAGSGIGYNLARLNTDGSLDETFELDGNGFDSNYFSGVTSVVVQSTGKIVVGGYFNHMNSRVCNRICRLNSDGSRDATFGPYYGANDGVDVIVKGTSDTLFIGGAFSQYGNKPLSSDFNFGNNQYAFGSAKLSANGVLSGPPLRHNFYRVGISDGGRYTYDSGNFFNTDLTQDYETIDDIGRDNYNCIPYTHSCVVGGEGDVDYMYYDISLDDTNYPVTPSDGRIRNANDYFGNGSRYFTNMFPGLFVLAANNITIEEFNITGDTGQDGYGDGDSGSFDITLNSYTFGCFWKSSYDSDGNPTLNHLIIVDGSVEGISQNVPDPYDDSNRGDDHILTGLSGRKELYVLVFAKADTALVNEARMKMIANAFVGSFVSPEVIKTCSNKGCGTRVGKVCKIGTNSCTCAQSKFYNTQCTRIQQALGICSATQGAIVPAITICNQRLF